jgi:hypothetical protein
VTFSGKFWVANVCWCGVAVAAYIMGSQRRSEPEVVRGTSETKPPVAMEAQWPSTRTQKGTAADMSETVRLEKTDLRGLAEMAVRDRNPVTRRMAFAKLLGALTPANAEGVRAQLLELGVEGEMWDDFHFAWGAIDGAKAFASAAKSPEQDMGATLRGWASADPQAALAMMDNLPRNMQGNRNELMAYIAEGLAVNDPNKAIELAQRLASSGYEKTANLMETVAAEQVRSKGVAEAALWAQNLPAGALKSSALRRISEVYARRDPEAAAKWVGSIAADNDAAGAIERLGSQWGVANPVAAADWLRTLPSSQGQSAGLRSIFGDWEDRDPVAAGDYLYRMPRTPQRDAAIGGFASGYAWQDPQTAIAWANDIGDPTIRENALRRVGRAYLRRDPNGAQAWLPNSGLSPETQQQVLTQQ